MFLPTLTRTWDVAGSPQSQQDVREVSSKVLAQQTFDVLYQDGFWLNTTNRIEQVGEKVPVVAVAAMLATKGEWLARHASGDQVNCAGVFVEVEGAHVCGNDRGPDGGQSAADVEAQCVAGVLVQLDKRSMSEARPSRAER
jgi:hypothetical protein